MDALKLAMEWAKAEIFSSAFFILFGVLFVSAGIGFWQFGKTEIAKAYIAPALVAGTLLLIIGIGLVYANNQRLKNFEEAYKQDTVAFMVAETTRAEKTMKEYQTVVFKIIPLIIVVAALAILFVATPAWRAVSITIIAMMAVILMVDSNAHARLEVYHKQLMTIEKDLKN